MRLLPFSSVSEILDVLFVCSRQQIEEGIETAIERPAQLWNRAVEGVEGQSGRRPIGELELASSSPFNEPSGMSRTP